jgi:hypothetical protein
MSFMVYFIHLLRGGETVQQQEKPLYDAFLAYSYPELEELLYSAKGKDEKDFYAGLCQFYVARKQKKVREEKPF